MTIINRNPPKIKRQEKETPTHIQVKTSGIDNFISVFLKFQINKRKALRVMHWLFISFVLFLIYILGTLSLPGAQELLRYLIPLLIKH